MFIYMGFRQKYKGIYWYFKDSVQIKFGHPIYGTYGFSCFEVSVQLYEPMASYPAILSNSTL